MSGTYRHSRLVKGRRWTDWSTRQLHGRRFGATAMRNGCPVSGSQADRCDEGPQLIHLVEFDASERHG